MAIKMAIQRDFMTALCFSQNLSMYRVNRAKTPLVDNFHSAIERIQITPLHPSYTNAIREYPGADHESADRTREQNKKKSPTFSRWGTH
jgi:hypothetical protein